MKTISFMLTCVYYAVQAPLSSNQGLELPLQANKAPRPGQGDASATPKPSQHGSICSHSHYPCTNLRCEQPLQGAPHHWYDWPCGPWKDHPHSRHHAGTSIFPICMTSKCIFFVNLMADCQVCRMGGPQGGQSPPQMQQKHKV